MKRYVKYEVDTGDVVGIDVSETPPQLPEAMSFLEVDLTSDLAPSFLKIVDGALVVREVEFLPALSAIEKPIDEAKMDRWAEARAYRERRINSSCVTPLGRVDTDSESRNKIIGAVQMAILARSMNKPFAIDWTMASNMVVEHDANAMIAMGLAVGEYVAACQNAATAIRNEINAAGSGVEVADIDIEAGYPSIESPSS